MKPPAAAESLFFRHAADEKHPDREEQYHRQEPGQEIPEERVLSHSRERHTIRLEPFCQRRIDPIGDDVLKLRALFSLERPLDVLRGDDHFAQAAVLQVLLELAVGDGLDMLRLRPEVLKHDDSEHRQDHIPQVDLHSPIHFAPPGKMDLGSDPRPIVMSIHMD